MADIATQIEALEQKAVTLKRQVSKRPAKVRKCLIMSEIFVNRKSTLKRLKSTKRLSFSRGTRTVTDLKL